MPINRTKGVAMNTFNQPLRCGILIVGSLFWDDEDRYRNIWRENRLDLTAKQFVSAPIRYGRKSKTWSDAFTMVLDQNIACGFGLLIPCKSQIRSFEQLIEEVQWLWSAESRKEPSNKFHAKWGCIGALFDNNTRNSDIHKKWKMYFEKEEPTSLPAIDREGNLNMPWPRTQQDAPVEDFDIILATATMPDPSERQLSAQQIADAWTSQNDGAERYFFRNVENGIRTKDDLGIWKAIFERAPSWLASEKYKSAIGILENESANAITSAINGKVDASSASAF